MIHILISVDDASQMQQMMGQAGRRRQQMLQRRPLKFDIKSARKLENADSEKSRSGKKDQLVQIHPEHSSHQPECCQQPMFPARTTFELNVILLYFSSIFE
ncbi:hypothetical protein DdX_11490 [Ditylenchus destructor]|uniref:Uncharacterized protein n=1 Tax=Ditylenchus destructor TaxID=166010 RepID=A0AAD4N012_9BILA|nr:hypothetical protein DdX_11490 [Ditylenchus destructor]